MAFTLNFARRGAVTSNKSSKSRVVTRAIRVSSDYSADTL